MATLPQGNAMDDVFEKLKEWLLLRKGNYVQVNEWCGSTETGFYDETTFDEEALMKEIDEFSKQLKAEQRK